MTYVVIAPDHPNINFFINKKYYNQCKEYIDKSNNKSDIERT